MKLKMKIPLLLAGLLGLSAPALAGFDPSPFTPRSTSSGPSRTASTPSPSASGPCWEYPPMTRSPARTSASTPWTTIP